MFAFGVEYTMSVLDKWRCQVAVTGKTGADAIFKALKRICIVITKYNTKLVAVVAAAEAASAITSSDASTITSFIAAANSACVAFQKLADYSGF